MSAPFTLDAREFEGDDAVQKALAFVLLMEDEGKSLDHIVGSYQFVTIYYREADIPPTPVKLNRTPEEWDQIRPPRRVVDLARDANGKVRPQFSEGPGA